MPKQPQSKQSKQNPGAKSLAETEPDPKRMGWTDFLGLVLLAAGLFNLPSILKKPESNADWMTFVIVLFMVILGLILLGLPRLLRKKSNE